ncbi:MAG: proline--tRNA ligase [Deltaproteobacteria bacterium]
MRYSRFFLPTVKEVPADAEVISHQLMLRAGMIRRLASGLYTYLPLGLRSLRKIESIIREEMDAVGAQELLMPMVQPAELWQESGRWEKYGRELLRFTDRHDRPFCLGPTHEEVITDLVRREVRSYRDLPLVFYQIQTKFRDEIRPRFGLMRGREFLMKDAYSFDVDDEGLDLTYRAMYDAYCRIFERCGLDYRPVEADTGTIGGHASHEFMVMAETGEDSIACCTACPYASNVELAQVVSSLPPRVSSESREEARKVSTPGKRSIEEVSGFLGIPPDRIVKTLIFITEKGPVAALVRGDHEINEIKLGRFLGVEEIRLASDEEVRLAAGVIPGFVGPVGLSGVRIVADPACLSMDGFVAGAGEEDYHIVGLVWGRDLPVPETADIRNITVHDPCPRCGGRIEIRRGIEVGHVFKLGTAYSEAMGARFLDENGTERPIIMGCYGIGVGRTLAAAIEQNHDANGIIFPRPIAPFDVIVCPVKAEDPAHIQAAEEISHALTQAGFQVLLDDRNLRPGVKFKDADLIGVPVRVTLGKLLADGIVEIRERRSGDVVMCPMVEVPERVSSLLAR